MTPIPLRVALLLIFAQALCARGHREPIITGFEQRVPRFYKGDC
jgi:hypothetical protein